MHSPRGLPPEPAAILQLWDLAAPPTHGPRARTDIHAVSAAAVRVADRDGFDAVTLAAVAKELGLTTTALYRYVDSKSTLVELMVDRALGIPPTLRNRTPERRVDAWLAALWSRYEQHPWLSTFPLERPPRSPNAVAWMDLLVTTLTDADAPDPLGAALAVDVLVRGYASLARVAALASPPSAELGAEIARRHPALTAGTGREGALDADLAAAVRRVCGFASR